MRDRQKAATTGFPLRPTRWAGAFSKWSPSRLATTASAKYIRKSRLLQRMATCPCGGRNHRGMVSTFGDGYSTPTASAFQMILDRTAWLAWLMYWTPLLRRGLQSDREPQGQAIPVKR